MSRRTKWIGVALVVIAALVYVYQLDFTRPEGTEFGVAFTPTHAQYLGLDWRKAYVATLDELKVKKIRIPAQWDTIEREPGEYDFSDLDWMLSTAADRHVKVVLVVGRRTPRWPECHDPEWVKERDKSPYGGSPAGRQDKQVSEISVEEAQVRFVEETVKHTQGSPAIAAWQVENEPYLQVFGKCPKMSKERLQKEIAIVRSLDPRPILVTDSGELSDWSKTAHLGDIFGTTVYRVVWNRALGYWRYDPWLPPAFYRVKAALVRKSAEEIVISELQAEPWMPGKSIHEVSGAEQNRSFDLVQFKRNVEFARRTGFREAYLWGAEYWYWMKEKGDPALWEFAKSIWSHGS